MVYKGSSQISSPSLLAFSINFLTEFLSFPNIPVMSSPRATMHPGQGGKVDDVVRFYIFSAYATASARASLPSASVLSTSMVFPLSAVTISPGRIELPETIFSHAGNTPHLVNHFTRAGKNIKYSQHRSASCHVYLHHLHRLGRFK